MRRFLILILIVVIAGTVSSCESFLDVTPDKTGTLENAFTQKSKAKKYLFSVYSYLPNFGNVNQNVGLTGGDEIWLNPNFFATPWNIARGDQKIVSPYYNAWEGQSNAPDLYEGIRKANIFMDNIHKVGNMSESLKKQWTAEAKFLKAYYYFYLIKMYGPVQLFKQNVPVTASPDQIKKPRAPLDSCFAYVDTLLNQVIHTPQLPDRTQQAQQDLGRITKSIAYSVKAMVDVTKASPLFNGNNDYKGFANVNGNNPFPVKYDPAKWDSALVSAKKAVDFVTSQGFQLYHFPETKGLAPTTTQRMTIRNSFAVGQGIENPEAVWAMPAAAPTYLQVECLPRGFSDQYPGNGAAAQRLSPPLKIAEMFYSNHGVPIQQDTSRNYPSRFELQEATSKDEYNIRQGYTTAKLNFDREPRFYANMGFDGAIWYGQGKTNDNPPTNLFYLQYKQGQINAIKSKSDNSVYSSTGYMVKKLINYKTQLTGNYGVTTNRYNWPQIRLSQLYLLYAEAKNEVDGPGPDVYEYLNKIRERAGIPEIQDAWTKWSSEPNEYKTQDGLRDIIHRETLIELAFEGKRFWDLRRWKEALPKLNENVTGWNIEESDAENYYNPRVIFNQQFSTKDYFWPLSENVLNRNTNLTQNPGW